MKALILLVKVLISLPFIILTSISLAVIKFLLQDELDSGLDSFLKRVDMTKVRNREDLDREVEIANLRDQQNERNERP